MGDLSRRIVMTIGTLAAPHPPVDGYRSTGTSPGRVARTLVRLGARDVDVVYQVYGPAHAPVTVVLGGISADRHLAAIGSDRRPGWWPGVVAPGGALDPDRQRLVGIDWVDDGDRPITTRDQARAVVAVLDHLGVERAAVVGASYGGMVGLALAATHTERVRALVALAAAHRPHPLATAWRVIQRRTARLASVAGAPELGVSLARALAMTTYRSAQELDGRFDWRAAGDADAPRFEVEAYLDARGADFARRFGPTRFSRLSESIDLHAVDPGSIGVPTTLVSFDTDALVPPWLVDELARGAPGVRCHLTLSSIFGHDAFLKEVDLVSDVVRSALVGEVAR
jgi:homoserine O-acetyltransferase